MKTFISLAFALFLGLSIGYQYADSRYAEVRRKLGALTDTDIEDYLKLKSNEAKFAKAEEILGKAILIYLADLGLRVSPQVSAFAKSAATGNRPTKLQPTEGEPIPTPNIVLEPSTVTHEKNKSNSIGHSSPAGPERRVERFTAGIMGRVTYTGIRPTIENIKMAADPVCAAINAGTVVPNETLVVNPNGTLANTFVYLKEGFDNKPLPQPPPSEPVTLNQEGCRYFPHVFGIQVGQPFQIINRDAVMHNVHSMAKQNPNFNMGMATKGQVIEKKFTKPETMVKMKCDVHGWMNAYVGVLEHPYFSVTNNTGAFSIKMPPPGNYLIEAWHEKLGTQSQQITILEGQLQQDVPFQFPN